MTRGPGDAPRRVALCCLVMVVALLVVGAVSHGVLRHIAQTSPLWIAIVLGIRGSGLSKWAALPSFVNLDQPATGDRPPVGTCAARVKERAMRAVARAERRAP